MSRGQIILKALAIRILTMATIFGIIVFLVEEYRYELPAAIIPFIVLGGLVWIVAALFKKKNNKQVKSNIKKALFRAFVTHLVILPAAILAISGATAVAVAVLLGGFIIGGLWTFAALYPRLTQLLLSKKRWNKFYGKTYHKTYNKEL